MIRASSGSMATFEPVERVVGGIGHDRRGDAGPAGERLDPDVERRAFARPDPSMVARLPGGERGADADDGFLADLHAAADAAVLQVAGADQLLGSGDDAGGRAAEELVAGIDRDVGAVGEEQAEVVFRGRVDDHRHAPGVADLDKGLERHLRVVDDVMGDDEHRGRGLCR